MEYSRTCNKSVLFAHLSMSLIMYDMCLSLFFIYECIYLLYFKQKNNLHIFPILKQKHFTYFAFSYIMDFLNFFF